MLLDRTFNIFLDALIHLHISLLRRTWLAFQLFGYVGLAIAILLTNRLAVARGLSPWMMAAIILTAVATFFVLAMATKIVVGRETLVYYHHQIAVLATAALLLRLLGQPTLLYLDITVLGFGAVVACGRIGCLMTGCCHGRPHRWGLRYSQAHAAAGFDPHLVGARLFPTQLVESLWVGCVVLVGSIMVLSGQSAGAALAWYLIAYGIGRFCLEFMRGDPVRPYYGGFSEAQWISAGLIIAVVVAELAGVLPWRWWHLSAAAGVLPAMVVVALQRRRSATYRLLHPGHISELAAALDRLAPADRTPTQDIQVVATRFGIHISCGVTSTSAGYIHHYSISSQNGDLTNKAVRIVAQLILYLKHPFCVYKLFEGDHDVFHLLVYPAESPWHSRL